MLRQSSCLGHRLGTVGPVLPSSVSSLLCNFRPPKLGSASLHEGEEIYVLHCMETTAQGFWTWSHRSPHPCAWYLAPPPPHPDASMFLVCNGCKQVPCPSDPSFCAPLRDTRHPRRLDASVLGKIASTQPSRDTRLCSKFNPVMLALLRVPSLRYIKRLVTFPRSHSW